MARITRLRFFEATGRMPEQDDLARCNCAKAGQIGHLCCGWNHDLAKPQFEVGPLPLLANDLPRLYRA